MKQRYTHISNLLFLSIALLCYLSTSFSAIPYFEINNKYIETGKTKLIKDLSLCPLLRCMETQVWTHMGNISLQIHSTEAIPLVFMLLAHYRHSIIA